MTKQIMNRKACDNEYLHKDFHGGMNRLIQYLDGEYGKQAVQDFLRRFTNVYYASVKTDIKQRGLTAIQDHIKRIYRDEKAEQSIHLTLKDDVLTVVVKSCPAVTYLRQKGIPVSELFDETTKTVYETLCEDTPYVFECVHYDHQTGHSIQKFFRRIPA